VNILKILPGIGFDWVNSETPAVSPLIAQLVAFHSWAQLLAFHSRAQLVAFHSWAQVVALQKRIAS